MQATPQQTSTVHNPPSLPVAADLPCFIRVVVEHRVLQSPKLKFQHKIVVASGGLKGVVMEVKEVLHPHMLPYFKVTLQHGEEQEGDEHKRAETDDGPPCTRTPRRGPQPWGRLKNAGCQSWRRCRQT